MSLYRKAFERLVGAAELGELEKRLHFGVDEGPLTDWQRLAIWLYTTDGGFHSVINTALRVGDPPPHLILVADCLREAVLRLPAFEGFVYRGVKVAGLEERLDTDYRLGNIVTWNAFTSATTRPALVYPGNLRFMIRSRQGRLLGFYSSNVDEAEALFVPSTRFAVLALDLKDGIAFVALDELEAA